MPSIDTHVLINNLPKGSTSSSLKVKPEQKFQQIFDEEKFKAQTSATKASQRESARVLASDSEKATSEGKLRQPKANSSAPVEVQEKCREIVGKSGKTSSQQKPKSGQAELAGPVEGNRNVPVAEFSQGRQDLPIEDTIAGQADESEARVSELESSLLSASILIENCPAIVRSEAGASAPSDNLASLQVVVPVATPPVPEVISIVPEIASTEPNAISNSLDVRSLVASSDSPALPMEGVDDISSQKQQPAATAADGTAIGIPEPLKRVDLNSDLPFQIPGESADPDPELAAPVTQEIPAAPEPVSSTLPASLGQDQAVVASRPKPDSSPLGKSQRVGLIDKVSQPKPTESIAVIVTQAESEGAASQNQAEPDRAAIGESAQRDRQSESATPSEALRAQKVPNPFLKELHAQLADVSRSEAPKAAEGSPVPSVTRSFETSGLVESLRVSLPSSTETPDAPTPVVNSGFPVGASTANAGLTERPSLLSNVAYHSNQVEKVNVISQLMEKAHLLVGKNQSEMTVVLKPEFLGRINLHAALVENSLVATLVAESPAVKQLLESQLSTLQTALQEQGLPVNKVEVVQGNQLTFSEFSQGQASSQQNFETRQSQAIPFLDGGLEGELEELKTIPAAPAILGYESSRSIHFIV